MQKHGSNPHCADSSKESGPFFAFEAPAMAGVKQIGAAYADACEAYCDEVLRFAKVRIDDDVKFWRSLAACSNWEELAELQQNWFTTVSQSYLNEGNRLFKLASEKSPACMSAASDREPVSEAA